MKTKTAKEPKRRDRYLVGYLGAKNTVYGQLERHDFYVDPLTLHRAKQKLAKMPCAGAAIFELVPITFNRKR